MIGKIISNYKITDFIEEGGMGTVYKGHHIHIERAVAIKVLHQNLTGNPEFRQRFLNEAKILAKMNHNNIVNIYDFIEQDGYFFIVTEFLEGMPLDKLIEANRLYSTDNSVSIFRQILSGIDYAHRNGIVHRDLKPSNIIVSSDYTAKILDFGIAKLSDTNKSMTKTGTKMGSLYYMSPEQVLGREIDFRTDIYSLGVVFFEMLTGKIPYNTNTESDYELMNSILTQGVPNLDFYISGVEPSINSIIQKACEKNAEDRFQSCAEFSNAFNDVNFNYSNINNDFASTKIISGDAQNNFSRTRFVESGSVRNQTIAKKSNNALIFTLIGICIAVTVTIIIILNLNNNKQQEISPVTDNSTQNSSSNNTGNTTNSGNKTQTPPSTQQNYSSSSSAANVVRDFITDLGSRNFRGAYNKQRNKAWGSYDEFSSPKRYGGITSTSIVDVSTNYEFSNEASVIADYYSYDPFNKDGRYKQEFILAKFDNEWKIIKAKSIKIDQW
ncbi:MAG: serine/threonine protein kinase [Ignavibacteria bacterium]|nr:serine/threonine protein kinase [Ignavibacteria bacterium]